HDTPDAAFAADLVGAIGAIADPAAPRPFAEVERVIRVGLVSDNPRHSMWAGACATWLGDDERAIPLWSRAVKQARAMGAGGLLVVALRGLSRQYRLAQRLDDAELVGTEAVTLGREVRAENLVALAVGVLASIAAIRGDEEAARRQAHDALAV